MPKKLPVSLAATGLVTALAVVVAGLGAEGQAAPGVYGQWTVAPADPTSTGTLSVPGSQVPDATFQTNSDSLQVPSGASAFLGDSTPFGAEYGSSQNLPYLVVRTDGTAPSTTTFTFAAPTPASGWGFAFGDVDADTVKVEAFDAAGAAVPTAALGWQSAFNYCTNSPRPTSCGAVNLDQHVHVDQHLDLDDRARVDHDGAVDHRALHLAPADHDAHPAAGPSRSPAGRHRGRVGSPGARRRRPHGTGRPGGRRRPPPEALHPVAGGTGRRARHDLRRPATTRLGDRFVN